MNCQGDEPCHNSPTPPFSHLIACSEDWLHGDEDCVYFL